MSEQTIYQIRIREPLDPKWKCYFEPFELLPDAGKTLLSGPVHDQAELFGILLKISNLGLTLLSVNSVPASEGAKPAD